jgi:hypothetical protein
MFDADATFDSSLAADSHGYDNTDDDDDDDDDDSDKDDDSQDDSDQDNDDSDQDGNSDSGGATVANASADEQDAHRNMLGTAMQHLADQGIDVDEIAENAGIDSSDVNALSHDDLATLTHYISENHPEVLQKAADDFPAAHGILGALMGGGGGVGGFFGKLFGGG